MTITPTEKAEIAEKAIDLYEMYLHRGIPPNEAKFKVYIDILGADPVAAVGNIIAEAMDRR